MSKFNKANFEMAFNKSLIALGNSEKITKAELLTCSRTVLEALHITEDIGYVNRLLGVLTPVNREVAVLYFKRFTGFSYDNEVLHMFTKKSKKRYDAAHKEAMVFLEDPHNNIWTYAAREVKHEEKTFSLDVVSKSIAGYLKKANANGVSQAEVMRAIVKGGITGDAILAILDEIGYDVAITEDNPATTSAADKVGEALV